MTGDNDNENVAQSLFNAIKDSDNSEFKNIVRNNAIDLRWKDKNRFNILETLITNYTYGLIRFLKKQEYDLNTPNEDGLTAIQFLLVHEEKVKLHDDIIEEWIIHGGDLSVKNKDGLTFLQWALLTKSHIPFILAQNDVANKSWKAVDKDFNTLLHFCVLNNLRSNVEFVSKKVNTLAKNVYGRTAIEEAILLKNDIIVAILLNCDFRQAEGLLEFINNSPLEHDEKMRMMSDIFKK
jgi:ankyrin repeat protein